MKLENIKEGVNSLLDSVAEGWHQLRESAANSLTRFKPSSESKLPAQARIDDPFYWPSHGWSMLGGEVFEDDKRLIVRLEVPGMNKQDMNIEISNGALILSGEKRFTNENTDGRWRIMQCAYGSFRRAVTLPTPVLADEAKATYTNGILRVELPKAIPAKAQPRKIQVN